MLGVRVLTKHKKNQTNNKTTARTKLNNSYVFWISKT